MLMSHLARLTEQLSSSSAMMQAQTLLQSLWTERVVVLHFQGPGYGTVSQAGIYGTQSALTS